MLRKLSLVLGVAMLSWMGSNAMADSNYGVYYNNTGTFVPGYYENPETGERSSSWQSGWTRVEGHNETVGAWHLDNTSVSNSKSTLFGALADSSLSLSVEVNNTTTGFTYGTFEYSADGTISNVQTVGTVGAGEVNSGTSTAYTSGDLVGVWVEANGKTYYSVNALNASNGSYQYTEGYGVDAVAGTAAVWFDDGLSISQGGVGSYGEGWPGQDRADIKILVTGAAPSGTSGAPLPGVFATMAMCGLVGGYFRRKKAAKK